MLGERTEYAAPDGARKCFGMRFYKDVAPGGAGSHVIFSGQTFYGAQSQNCETEKTHARPARKTGDGDSEVNFTNEC